MNPTRSLLDVLDALPRSHISLANRIVPVFRCFAILGASMAWFHVTLLAIVLERSVAVQWALGALFAAMFLLWSLLRRRIVGRETSVLYEHVVAMLGSGALALYFGQLSVLEHLDVAVAGVATALAVTRIGCFIAGCCYGVPSDCGVLYPHECDPDGVPTRRFPVQLLECSAWGLLSVSASWLVIRSLPGTALGLVIVGYALVRVALEQLRGDRQSRFGPWSHAVWFALMTAPVGICLLVRRTTVMLEAAVFLGGGAACAVLVALGARVWIRGDDAISISEIERLESVGRGFEQGGSVEPVRYQVDPWTVAVSWSDDGPMRALWISVSHRYRIASRAEAMLIANAILSGTSLRGAPLELRAIHGACLVVAPTAVGDVPGVTHSRDVVATGRTSGASAVDSVAARSIEPPEFNAYFSRQG